MKITETMKKVKTKVQGTETHTVVLWILLLSQLFAVFGRYIPKSEYFLMFSVLVLVLITGKRISGKALSAAAAFVGAFLIGIVLSFLLGTPNYNAFLCVAFSAQTYLFVSLATDGDGKFTTQQLNDFWNMILLVGIFACGYNLLTNIEEIWNMTPEGYAYGVNFSAFYAGRNEFAYYLLLNTAISAYQFLTQKKAKYGAVGVLFLLNLFLTFSRASILATVVFLAVLLLCCVWKEKRIQRLLLKVMIPGLLVGALVIWLNFDFLDQYLFRTGYGDSYRFLWWKTGLSYLVKSPIFGFGPGAAEFLLKGLGDNTGSSFHNTFVEILVWGGVALTALFVLITIQVFKRVVYIKKHDLVFYRVYISLFAAYLTYGMFETNMLFSLGAKGVVTTILFYVVPSMYALTLRRKEILEPKNGDQYPQDEIISVVIPAYNAQDTLRACLESVQKQTYRNIEVIVVDDGSVDETGRIAQEFAEKDSRFVYYRKENGGQSSARNMGLSKMHGSLFTYVDSDDYVMPDMLMQLYSCMKDGNADMSMCAMIRKKGETETEMYVYDEHIVNDRQRIYQQFLAEKYIFGPVCKLFTTAVYGDVLFLEGTIFEDIEMLSRAYLKSQRVALCPYPGYVATVREGSTTKSDFGDKKLDLLTVTHIIQKRAEESGIECEQELLAFVLNGYLSVLLMALDAGKLEEYAQVCNSLVQWIRERERTIYFSRVITLRKKIYAFLFTRKHPVFLKLLKFVRSGLN